MRIGIFGGTFDPPHNGHINAAKKAKSDLKLDRLLIMPAFMSPFKTKQAVTPAPLRLMMCYAAFGSFAEVSDYEINKPEVNFTINTVCYIKKQWPSADIYLIGGSDIRECFDDWKDSDKLKKLTSLYIIPRELVPVSSTEIREKIRNNEDVTELLTPDVLEIIRKHNIYNDR
jgi:nicotinate-nucleotide adenylyltransferase